MYLKKLETVDSKDNNNKQLTTTTETGKYIHFLFKLTFLDLKFFIFHFFSFNFFLPSRSQHRWKRGKSTISFDILTSNINAIMLTILELSLSFTTSSPPIPSYTTK